MSSSTSSFDSGQVAVERDARRFLILLVLFVVGIECAAVMVYPRQQGRHEVDRRIGQVLQTSKVPRGVLLSDSISYEVLSGANARPDVLDLSSNQTIGVAGNYFLLRRFLNELGREADAVQRVIYTLSPYSLSENLDAQKFQSTYFTSVFLGLDEIDDIRSLLGRNDLVEAMLKARRRCCFELPLAKRSGLVRDPLGVILREFKNGLKRGASIPKVSTDEAKGTIEKKALRTRVEASQVTEVFLPRMADLCAQHDIEFLIVTAPLPPSLRSAWEANGYEADLVRFRSGLLAANLGMTWVHPCPYAPPTDTFFYDGVHLVQDAKDAWGKALMQILMNSPR